MARKPALSTQTASPSAPHRLDKLLFWLRWLFLAGSALAVLVADDTLLGEATTDHDRLPVILGVAVAGNLVVRALSLVRRAGDRLLGALGILLDCAVAALFLWAYESAAAPWLFLAALAMLVAAYRYTWTGIMAAGGLLAASSALVIATLGDPSDDLLVNWALGLGFVTVLGLVGVALQGSDAPGTGRKLSLDEREQEALRLRSARERARAIYEMANTLSATLDHQQVLEAAQMIGALGLREDLGTQTRLVSAVLLFQGKDNKLRVVSSRGLTRADTQVAVPGHKGLLGLALKQTAPVFGGDATRDPELRYFAAFQDSKSILAIPLRAQYDHFGVMLFGCDQPNAFTDEHVELMTAIGTQSTMALQNAVLYQNLVEEKEKIVEVEEDARKKLARDLHDGPTQSVAAIAMRVNFIRRLIERQPQQALEELWKVEELARRTTKEIRHMLFTLRPLVLETQGLIAALQQLAEKMLETHDTKVTIRAQKEVEDYLDTNAQGVLFYVVEEAVNNARKHSQAEEIVVRLYRRRSFVMVEIEDNGVGFDVGAVHSDYDQRGSLGMINMRERAELVEGQLRIQSAPGRGTKISVLIPIQFGGAAGEEAGARAPSQPLTLQSQRKGVHAPADTSESKPRPPATRPSPPPAPKPADTSDPAARRLSRREAPPSDAPRSPSGGRPPSRLRRPDRPRPRASKEQSPPSQD